MYGCCRLALRLTSATSPLRAGARDLTAAGFDPAKKTLWFMEGFTGYLEVDELRLLLK